MDFQSPTNENNNAETLADFAQMPEQNIASDEKLTIRIKTLSDSHFQLIVDRNILVSELKTKVEDSTEVPSNLQRLIYRGKLLKDSENLAFYKVEDGHTLHLVSKKVSSNATNNVEGTRTEYTDRNVNVVVDDNRINHSVESNLMRSSIYDGNHSENHSENHSQRMMVMDVARARSRSRSLSRPPLSSSTTTNTTNTIQRPTLASSSSTSTTSSLASQSLWQLLEDVNSRFTSRSRYDRSARTRRRRSSQSTRSADSDTTSVAHLHQNLFTLRTLLSTISTSDSRSFPLSSPSDTTPMRSSRTLRKFFVGQWLDVKDTVNQWLESTVMDIRDNELYVHYNGWPTRWDEWIAFDSDRLAPFRSRTVASHRSALVSPTPTLRVNNAPNTGENDIRAIIPDLLEVMQSIIPHVESLSELSRNSFCMEEQNGTQSFGERTRDGKNQNQMQCNSVSASVSVSASASARNLNPTDSSFVTGLDPVSVQLPESSDEQENHHHHQEHQKEEEDSDDEGNVLSDLDDNANSNASNTNTNALASMESLSRRAAAHTRHLRDLRRRLSDLQTWSQSDHNHEEEKASEPCHVKNETHRQLRQQASNVAPLFDRLGRMLMDAAVSLRTVANDNHLPGVTPSSDGSNTDDTRDNARTATFSSSSSSSGFGGSSSSSSTQQRNSSTVPPSSSSTFAESRSLSRRNSSNSENDVDNFRQLVTNQPLSAITTDRTASRGSIDIHVHAILAPIGIASTLRSIRDMSSSSDSVSTPTSASVSGPTPNSASASVPTSAPVSDSVPTSVADNEYALFNERSPLLSTDRTAVGYQPASRSVVPNSSSNTTIDGSTSSNNDPSSFADLLGLFENSEGSNPTPRLSTNNDTTFDDSSHSLGMNLSDSANRSLHSEERQSLSSTEPERNVADGSDDDHTDALNSSDDADGENFLLSTWRRIFSSSRSDEQL